MVGRTKTPLLPPVFPDWRVVGWPKPKAPALTREEMVVRGTRNPKPTSISFFTPVIVAGFQ